MIDKNELGLYVEAFSKEIVLEILKSILLKETSNFDTVLAQVWVDLIRDGYDGEDVHYVFTQSITRAQLMVAELLAQFNKAMEAAKNAI